MTSTTPPTEPTVTPDERRAPGRGRRWGRILALVLGAPILAVLAVWVGLKLFSPHPYSGLVMQAPEDAPSLADLTTDDGQPLDLTAWRGDVVILFFGYTSCPDVCPTTLANVAAAKRLLSDREADRVHLVMISVDPGRDDPAQVGEYVRSFDPDFRGATGPKEALDRATTLYSQYYELGPVQPNGSYEVIHTASLIGIAPDGHVRLLWTTTVEPQLLAADLSELL